MTTFKECTFPVVIEATAAIAKAVSHL